MYDVRTNAVRAPVKQLTIVLSSKGAPTAIVRPPRLRAEERGTNYPIFTAPKSLVRHL